jgi:hypothetical protein
MRIVHDSLIDTAYCVLLFPARALCVFMHAPEFGMVRRSTNNTLLEYFSYAMEPARFH